MQQVTRTLTISKVPSKFGWLKNRETLRIISVRTRRPSGKLDAEMEFTLILEIVILKQPTTNPSEQHFVDVLCFWQEIALFSNTIITTSTQTNRKKSLNLKMKNKLYIALIIIFCELLSVLYYCFIWKIARRHFLSLFSRILQPKAHRAWEIKKTDE